RERARVSQPRSVSGRREVRRGHERQRRVENVSLNKMRSAECGIARKGRSRHDAYTDVPHSAFHIPHSPYPSGTTSTVFSFSPRNRAPTFRKCGSSSETTKRCVGS